MKNQALIAEVVSQISQRFTPKIGDIKKAIETLLEKEYIERAEGQRDVSSLRVSYSSLTSNICRRTITLHEQLCCIRIEPASSMYLTACPLQPPFYDHSIKRLYYQLIYRESTLKNNDRHLRKTVMKGAWRLAEWFWQEFDVALVSSVRRPHQQFQYHRHRHRPLS